MLAQGADNLIQVPAAGRGMQRAHLGAIL
jgi:hypothetical protein